MKILKLLLCVAMWCTAEGQSIDPVSLLLTKAVKAIDLKVQRLQNETLVLQRAQQLAEQELAKVKLDEIRKWQHRLSALYAGYFAELKQVKTNISGAAMVKSIHGLEEQVWMEYRKFPTRADQTAVFNQSKEIGKMLNVVLSNQVSMKDADRLVMLYTLRDAMFGYLKTLQALNQQQLALVEKGNRVQSDTKAVKRLYGIQ